MNVGKACGTDEGLRSVIGVVSESVPKWTILFLSEVDRFRDKRPPLASYHLTYRHWPGEGSFAMQIIVQSSLRRLVQSIVWCNRCGALHLFQKNTNNIDSINSYVIVLHNAHGDLQDDVLLDIAQLVRRRPRLAQFCILGDWNIDQLPVQALDPWAGQGIVNIIMSRDRSCLRSASGVVRN